MYKYIIYIYTVLSIKYKGILWTEGVGMLSCKIFSRIRALLEDDLQRQEYLHAIRHSNHFLPGKNTNR